MKAKAIADAAKQVILDRQESILSQEVNFEWRVVFGSVIPKKKKDSHVITQVTRRNIWMEPHFLFDQIQAFQPEEFFHPCSAYALKWQPAGSLYQLIIPLDNPQIQENAVIIMSNFNPIDRRNTLFHFAPVDPAMPMFAPRVHPSSLLSYHTKNEVLKKLCDCFLEDKISVNEIQAVLMCDQYVWKASLYNLLQEDEQVYHKYLLENKPLADVKKSQAKSYIDGEITLDQYEDSTFPERKRLREVEEMKYPLPVQMETCTICTRENCAVVQCQTCANMVCPTCVTNVFSGKQGRKSVSFLLMHQKFCMKLGELSTITVVVTDEPAYLREFRRSSRKAALEILLPEKPDQVFKEEELEEDEDEIERLRLAEEEKRRLAAEEAARIALENPEALQDLQEDLDRSCHLLKRIGKDLREFEEKILDKARTEQYVARNMRLRAEGIEKMLAQVLEPIERIVEEATALQITGSFIEELLHQAHAAVEEVEALSVEVLPPENIGSVRK